MSKPNGQKAACDRCRGQKLRCIWQAGEPRCQRCQRANAVCTIPLPRPMGRPPCQQPHASSHDSRRQARGAAYGWDEEHFPSAVSDENNTMMAMNQPNINGPSDMMFDIFQCLPNSGDLDVCSTSGSPVFATTPAMAVLDPGSSSNRIDAGSSGLSVRLDGFDQLSLGNQGDEHDELLKQLCDINLCLSRHPLHRKRYNTAKPPGVRSQSPLRSSGREKSSSSEPVATVGQ